MNAGLKKAILLGVGAFHLTKEKINDVIKDLEKEGALDENEGKQLFTEMMSKSEERAREFKDMVSKEVKRVLDEMIESVEVEEEGEHPHPHHHPHEGPGHHHHEHDHDHEHEHGEDCHDCCCGMECCEDGHKCGEGECECKGNDCDCDCGRKHEEN
jgi:polyhydroxyalkanoate synthesis regulator phasin